MTEPINEPPLNPMPPVVVALALVLFGIELAFSMGARGLIGGPEAVGWRLLWGQDYAFSPRIFDWMRSTGQFPTEHVIRFVSFPFVHANFTNALFACVMLLALGKMVAEAFGPWRFLAIFFLSTIGAALVYGGALPDAPPLLGAFPPIYGLIGAFTYLLWLRLEAMGGRQMQAFGLIGVLMGLQLIFGLFFGANLTWVADLAGFAVGFVLSLLLVPGGWRHLLSRIRRD